MRRAPAGSAGLFSLPILAGWRTRPSLRPEDGLWIWTDSLPDFIPCASPGERWRRLRALVIQRINQNLSFRTGHKAAASRRRPLCAYFSSGKQTALNSRGKAILLIMRRRASPSSIHWFFLRCTSGCPRQN